MKGMGKGRGRKGGRDKDTKGIKERKNKLF
jgi:hypothetical protein